jgi:integrase/recombinase XerD
MGTLRKRMTDAMKLRRFSPRTQQSYLAAVTALPNYYHTRPDQLDFEKIKAYLLHLTVERALSWSTCNVVVSALRFFYLEVAGWEQVDLPLPPRKKPKTPRFCSATRKSSGSLRVLGPPNTGSC